MRLNSSPRLLLAIAVPSLALVLGGCVSKDERAARRRWETEEERTDREIFHVPWIRPPIPDEDREFFYPASARRRND
jgi:hypothetical protein